jgi:hypothetical protein
MCFTGRISPAMPLTPSLPASGRERGEVGGASEMRHRQAHARVRREGREGEGRHATDLGRFGELGALVAPTIGNARC